MRIVKLPFKVKKPILACGADLKGAFALAKGDEAYLADGFGDLADLENFTRYEKAVRAAIKKLSISPKIIACDLHPDYFSTRFAKKLQSECDFSLYRAQHHEAHIASSIADNSIKGGVIGVAFDGTGYGIDGNIWGGEFFVGSLKKFTRVAHLGYVPMPGGELAIREPWRMAVSYLYCAFGKRAKVIIERTTQNAQRTTKKVRPLLKMIDKGINSPLTSSAGRLFDAAGSLVLGKMSVEKEAELPIALERIAIELCRDNYKFDVVPEGKALGIDCKKMIRGICGDIKNRVDRPSISSKFHNTVAEIISDVSVRLRKKFRIGKVVLSGGVFQNAYLMSRATELLVKDGFKVFTHSAVSTNDSGIPLGQIAIARARCA